jgi:hypothetical protein
MKSDHGWSIKNNPLCENWEFLGITGFYVWGFYAQTLGFMPQQHDGSCSILQGFQVDLDRVQYLITF